MRKRDRYAGLRSLLRGGRTEEEIREEFAHHMTSRIEDYMASGLTPEAAREEAMRRLGDVERYVGETRAIDRSRAQERRRREWVGSARREVRQALRSLARSPLFALVAVLTLGMGMGATGAIFTLLDAVVLRPLPYAGADDLVYVNSPVSGGGADGEWGVSPAGYFYYRDHTRTLDGVGIYSSWPVTLSGDADAERVVVGTVNAALFQVLRAKAAVGRLFLDADDQPGGASVVVLSHRLWLRRYGGDEGIVGRTVQVDATPAEVIGVLPAGFGLPEDDADVYMPRRLNAAGPFVNEHYLSVVARLRPGENVATAQQDLERLTARFTEVYPQVYPTSFMENYHFTVAVQPLRDHVLGNMSRTLWILFAAVAVVLIIAAANVANLFLVRSEVRRRESAVRGALGAELRHLAWHSLTESLLIAGFAAALGLLLAYAAVRVLPAVAPESIPRLEGVHLSGSTITVLAALAVAAGLVFGSFPLLRSTRDATLVLRESGRGLSPSRRQHRVRSGLVVAQIALSLTLLAAAGLLLRSFARLRNVDPGLDARGVVTMNVALPYARYKTYAVVNDFYRNLLGRLETLPGVVRAAASTALPIGGGEGCSVVFVEDRPLAPGEEPPCPGNALVSPGYFEAMGIAVAGHAPTWADNDARAGLVVVSRALAQRFWPGQDGQHKGIKPNGPQPPFYRVAGVTADVRTRGLDVPATEVVYYPLLPLEGAPLWSPPRFINIVLKTRLARPLSIVPEVRRVLSTMDADVPLANISTMESVVARSLARRSFAMLLLGLAAVMALVLSTVGIYGVISYIVGQRRAEIGVRMALGAPAAGMSRMVVAQSLRLTGAGIAIGLIVTLLSARALTSLLFEVSATDPLTLLAGSALLLIVATAASWLPARRAAKVDPVMVMKAE
jgi:predicted permease